MPTEFLKNREIYEKVIQQLVTEARDYIWIATADIKDMYVSKGKRMVPFLEILSDAIENGVSVRLLHAKEPGPNFRKDFDKYPVLIQGLERMMCPRVHFKSVIVDGRKAYIGSANLTGAGMGAKGDHRRNFEFGLLTDDAGVVDQVAGQFDQVWIGSHCAPCGRRAYCSDCPLD